MSGFYPVGAIDVTRRNPRGILYIVTDNPFPPFPPDVFPDGSMRIVPDDTQRLPVYQLKVDGAWESREIITENFTLTNDAQIMFFNDASLVLLEEPI